VNRTTNHPSFSRPLWAEIDLGALRHNVRCLRSRNGGLILPVLKANAYGHGVIVCAQALQPDLRPGEMFCVASVDEGIQLRKAGIATPILLLSALLPEEAEACVEHNLTATISTFALAQALNDAASERAQPAQAHFKIDTGMGRLGAPPHEAVDLWKQLSQLPHVAITGVYTHFACADEVEDEMTREQNELFKTTLEHCGIDIKDASRALIHAANSAAAWRHPATAFDAVRPGISIYGISPFAAKVLSETLHNALRPVMSLKARVTLTRQIPGGASVSYGATWRSGKAARLAVIPVGYADGYHRSLSNCGKVLLRDQLCPIVGRVTMDQIIVDVTALDPAVQIGEEVTLWGDGLPVENVATLAGTIGYEMLTGVAARVPRVYKEGNR
jgi:alanine racemase